VDGVSATQAWLDVTDRIFDAPVRELAGGLGKTVEVRDRSADED
jgi:hypothetical protein